MANEVEVLKADQIEDPEEESLVIQFKKPYTFEGKVYCNGTDLVQNFQALKSVIGFVPQQDIIYENLTLQKMLYLSLIHI